MFWNENLKEQWWLNLLMVMVVEQTKEHPLQNPHVDYCQKQINP